MVALTIVCTGETSEGRICGAQAIVLNKHAAIRGPGALVGSNIGYYEIHFMIECPQCGIRTQVEMPSPHCTEA